MVRCVDDSGGRLQSIQGGRSGESRETGSHRQKVGGQLVLVSVGGLCKEKISEITMEVGGSRSLIFFLKSSKNSPKPVLLFWNSIPCVSCLYLHC